MENTAVTNWTKEDLKTYLMIFCANADFVEEPQEVAFIKGLVGEETFVKMHHEFESDNDYQSIQKIQQTAKSLGYSKSEIEGLFEDIKELFLSDGKLSLLEDNLMMALHKII